MFALVMWPFGLGFIKVGVFWSLWTVLQEKTSYCKRTEREGIWM